MHDTVTKIRKKILREAPGDEVAALVSERLQEAGLSRALAEPISTHLELLYVGAFQWVRILLRATAEGTTEEDRSRARAELLFSSRHLAVVLGDVIPFLERAEDILSEREEITHRESHYEREVAPFSRHDSTEDIRGYFLAQGFSTDLAMEGAQAGADLMKIVYLQGRLAGEAPKAADLYALVAELVLDSRRHLLPLFSEGSAFLKQLETGIQAA
jgi:hypothetical protein